MLKQKCRFIFKTNRKIPRLSVFNIKGKYESLYKSKTYLERMATFFFYSGLLCAETRVLLILLNFEKYFLFKEIIKNLF